MQSVAKKNRRMKPGLTTKPFAMNYIKIVTLSKLFASYSFMAEGVGNVRTKRSHPKHSALTYPERAEGAIYGLNEPFFFVGGLVYT